MVRFLKTLKDFLLFSHLLHLFRPFKKFFAFTASFNDLTTYVRKHKKGLLICDFYTPVRDYNKRQVLYKTVSDHYGLHADPILYLEFGVAYATSFKWWLGNNTNSASGFHGFDTFEGLPEAWNGIYAQGAMSANLPDISDPRAAFYKGLFQETLCPFIQSSQELLKRPVRKVIHMDADLFSSTIFVLSQLYPYLKEGDIVLFDEFNVAEHEWKAFDIFTKAFYVKMTPIAAVNNFYQTAFVVG